ncbi:MAG: NUDIX hydrolase [Candidatus Velthaea sp.]
MEILRSRRIYEGNVINLRVDEVRTETGDHSYEVVEHRGAVVVIVRPTPDTMVLVRQYRHALMRHTWEACAGTIDAGEQPRDAALRELREETGYRARSIRRLWSAFSAPGFCDELLHFFVTDDVEPGETDFDAGEDIEMRTFDLAELRELVQTDQLRDSKTQIAVLWALTDRS